jgi:hypothetical protein
MLAACELRPLKGTPKDLLYWVGLRQTWINLCLLELRGFVGVLAGGLVRLFAEFDRN